MTDPSEEWTPLRDRLEALNDGPYYDINGSRVDVDALIFAAAKLALLYVLDDDRTPEGETIGSESGDMMEGRIRRVAAEL